MKAESLHNVKFLPKNSRKRAKKLNKKLRNKAQRNVSSTDIPDKGIKGWAV
jgi:hypothetical protein